MMADNFVYMGGNQVVPFDVRRVRIHKSVKIVRRSAFLYRQRLTYVEFHDEIEIIEEEAFEGCVSLRKVKLLGVKVIKADAFKDCSGLLDVEFGDKLETIERQAFYNCNRLKNIRMPSVRTVGKEAFALCTTLLNVEFGEKLEMLQEKAFDTCRKLKRIVLPLKSNMIEDHVFILCEELETVDLTEAEGIHKLIASLHLESWRNEMNTEINCINQVLPLNRHKIRLWMREIIDRLDHYKSEHHRLLKEATTLLELALWKANLDDNNGGEGEGVRTTRSRRKRARKEICVTSGADVVIKNVLPFLQLLE